MGLKQFRIEFTHPGSSVFASQTLRGKVVLELSSDKVINCKSSSIFRNFLTRASNSIYSYEEDRVVEIKKFSNQHRPRKLSLGKKLPPLSQIFIRFPKLIRKGGRSVELNLGMGRSSGRGRMKLIRNPGLNSKEWRISYVQLSSQVLSGFIKCLS